MPRPRDNFDDEDFDGYKRPRARESGSGSRVAVTVIVGIVLILIVGGVFLFVIRGRRAEHAAERARADMLRFEQVRAGSRAMATSERAWPRMIGVWTRTPAEKEEGGYPYRFEFDESLRATTLRATDGGEPYRQESTVEVLSDYNDTVRLRLHVPMGLYGYTLTLTPDGKLLLDDGKGGLVFQRVP